MPVTPGDLDPQFFVPDALCPRDDLVLPTLTLETIDELRLRGWSRVGIMVAFTDSDGNVMMLEHNARDKNRDGVLGPLGETTQQSGPIIEQPIQTLFRGIQEELGIQYPTDLAFSIHKSGGWVINRWPRGDSFPGQYACAISFPVFMPDIVKAYLLSIPHGTEEVRNIHFLPPAAIMEAPNETLRSGVKEWLRQVEDAGLLVPEEFEGLQPLDFSQIYESSLRDIELKK